MGMSEHRRNLIDALQGVDEANIEKCADAIISALRKGKKILIAGNGGSAADAQHFAAELTCTFESKGRKALPALALTTNSSVLTAWSNDFSFDSVFERQVEALGSKGDILVSITTSGNSKNMLAAMEKAKRIGMLNILLSGKTGGEAAKRADCAILINSDKTPRVQECHIFCIHEMCRMIDEEFKNEK